MYKGIFSLSSKYIFGVEASLCGGACEKSGKKRKKKNCTHDATHLMQHSTSCRRSDVREGTNLGSLVKAIMHFCPRCGNLLLVEDVGGMRFCCPTCPYVHNIKEKFVSHVSLKVKEVDDVLGGAAAWENVDRTETRCPFCDHNIAFFMQIQIRSADEPMTTFYRCVKCTRQWHD
jgi:DNA-directed RNA polymerase III subunit RPC11